MMCSAPGPVPDGLDGRSQIDSAVLGAAGNKNEDLFGLKEKVERSDGAIRAGEQQMSKPPMDGMAWHGMARSLFSTCWDKSSPEGQDDEVADWLAQNPEKSLMESLSLAMRMVMRAARHSQERVNNRMLRCRRVYYVRILGKEGGQGGQGTRLRGVDGTKRFV